MGHRHYSVLHIARSDEAHYGPKSRQKPQTTGNNQGFALVMGKMLMCNQINLCVFLLRVNNRMETGAIECIHCSPCTPPFFAVNKR